MDAVFGEPTTPAQAVTRSKKRAEAAGPRGKAWCCVYCVCVGLGRGLSLLGQGREAREGNSTHVASSDLAASQKNASGLPLYAVRKACQVSL